jgi:fluoroacetyl-CoA thioesterase
MRDTLKSGLTFHHVFTVPKNKTVPHLFPEAPELQVMPEVFATGFMVGLMEWSCVKLLEPHLEPGDGSLGVHIDVSHKAPTPPGLTVSVEVECIEVRGPRVRFNVVAHDGFDEIGAGTHERFIISLDRFNRAVAAKAERASAQAET